MSRIARDPKSTPHITATKIALRGEPFEVHLAVPATPRPSGVLVLYASGDGGWFGAAVDMFRVIGDAGFYGVGVSTRSLLRAKAGGVPVVADLAEDYGAILAGASEVLHLPADHAVVLSGWSRGASLAVLIGASRHAPPHLAGVVAIGLTADENLSEAGGSDDDPSDDDLAVMRRRGGSVALYPLIAEVTPARVAVLQATGDKYLPAAQARQLFGPDSAQRRFYEVAAKNHRFGGGEEAFASSLRASLDWVVGASPVP